MKKSFLGIAALSTALLAGSTPMLTQAAAPGNVSVQSGKGLTVISGQSMESLQETLKELGLHLENNGFLCPDLPGNDNHPEIPDVEAPETPTPEKPETPDTETPSPEQPDTPETETPDAEALSYAEQVVKLVNEERAKAGLSALTMDADITAAANVRAKEIKQSFSHTRPDGTSFSTALKEQGVSYRGSGENIAWGQKSPEQVMNGWMNSDGHRANILNPNFKNIGVGYYQDASGVNHWVQLFTY